MRDLKQIARAFDLWRQKGWPSSRCDGGLARAALHKASSLWFLISMVIKLSSGASIPVSPAHWIQAENLAGVGLWNLFGVGAIFSIPVLLPVLPRCGSQGTMDERCTVPLSF
ncbi:hypothetical protein BD779DRAFT_1477106 [Infundibulicybe gibba]|nr:hypothetical protein BD779DRAFT_1477106 [Infundibulicybe gibba]